MLMGMKNVRGGDRLDNAIRRRRADAFAGHELLPKISTQAKNIFRHHSI